MGREVFEGAGELVLVVDGAGAARRYELGAGRALGAADVGELQVQVLAVVLDAVVDDRDMDVSGHDPLVAGAGGAAVVFRRGTGHRERGGPGGLDVVDRRLGGAVHGLVVDGDGVGAGEGRGEGDPEEHRGVAPFDGAAVMHCQGGRGGKGRLAGGELSVAAQPEVLRVHAVGVRDGGSAFAPGQV